MTKSGDIFNTLSKDFDNRFVIGVMHIAVTQVPIRNDIFGPFLLVPQNFELLTYRLKPGLAPVPLTVLRSNSKFDQNMVRFKICSNNHTEILHTSRQLHCRDVYKISLRPAEYILSQSTANFARISNSMDISLVGRALGLCTANGKDNNENLCLVNFVVPWYGPVVGAFVPWKFCYAYL